MVYVVIETQSNGETASVITNNYTEKNDAENKYHTILAFAATSQVPIHSAVMLTEEGYYIKSECYEHKSEVTQ